MCLFFDDYCLSPYISLVCCRSTFHLRSQGGLWGKTRFSSVPSFTSPWEHAFLLGDFSFQKHKFRYKYKKSFKPRCQQRRWKGVTRRKPVKPLTFPRYLHSASCWKRGIRVSADRFAPRAPLLSVLSSDKQWERKEEQRDDDVFFFFFFFF